jgi:hypothetical protein
MILNSQGRDWLDCGDGTTVPLPAVTTPAAVRWAKLLVALIAPHTTILTHDQWTWNGDDALIEQVIQAIMNEQTNNALLSVERAVVKELR